MIFVDTRAWIALTDRSDQHHLDAVAIYTKLKKRRVRFLTTDYIIDETVTRLRYDVGHRAAVAFLDSLSPAEKASNLRVVRIDETLFASAVSIFRQFDTAVLSLTDCTSFAVCKAREIDEAFGFDQHFTMTGIALVLP